MWHDLLTLSQLEAKRRARQIAYGLRLLGVERTDSRLYQAYVVGFWLFWLFAMGAFLLDAVEQLGRALLADDAAALLDGVPVLVLFAQLAYLVVVYLNPPLKLAAPDLAYVAASPASRGAIALVRFVSGMLLPASGLALAGSLAALLFAWSLDAPGVARIGARAFWQTFALALLSAAVGWTLALARQNTRSPVKHAWWLVFPVVALGAALLPGAILWPGRVWTGAILNASIAHGPLLIVAIGVALAAVAAAGSRTHMAQVMDLSQMYARIHRLGMWGFLEASDVITRLRAQSRLARKTRLRGRLPHTSGAVATLLGQSALIVARLSPGIVVRLLVAGVTAPSVAIALVRLGGASPVQTWALIFVALIQFRPREALRVYQVPVDRPFVRQFLPRNNLLRFAGQVALPLAIMGVGAALTAIAQPWVPRGIALPLVLGALLAQALCQALDTARLPDATMPPVRYEYAILVCGALVVGSGLVVGSVWAALLALLLVDLGLALLLSRSLPA